jgi:hypothetical protein
MWGRWPARRVRRLRHGTERTAVQRYDSRLRAQLRAAGYRALDDENRAAEESAGAAQREVEVCKTQGYLNPGR